MKQLKFIYSEKATKLEISQDFMAFSEYMNFTYMNFTVQLYSWGLMPAAFSKHPIYTQFHEHKNTPLERTSILVRHLAGV